MIPCLLRTQGLLIHSNFVLFPERKDGKTAAHIRTEAASLNNKNML